MPLSWFTPPSPHPPCVHRSISYGDHFPEKNSGKKGTDTGTSWVATKTETYNISQEFIFSGKRQAWPGKDQKLPYRYEKKRRFLKVSRISSEAPSEAPVQIWKKEGVSKGLQDKPGTACCPMFNLTRGQKESGSKDTPPRPKQQSQNQIDCCPPRCHSCHLLYLLLILSFSDQRYSHAHCYHTDTLYARGQATFFFNIYFYLPMPDLSCGTQDSQSLQQVNSCFYSMWDPVSQLRMEPGFPALGAQEF